MTSAADESSSCLLTVQGSYRREGKGLLLLKLVSHFFPRRSKVWLQNLLDVVGHRHLQVLQLRRREASDQFCGKPAGKFTPLPFRVSRTTYSSSYPSSSGSPVFGSQSLTRYFMVQLKVQDTGGNERHFRCRNELLISEQPDFQQGWTLNFSNGSNHASKLNVLVAQ